jgi:hypothetical protein
MRTTVLRLVISSAAAIVLALATQASAQDAPSASVGRTRAAKIIATLPNTITTSVCSTPVSPMDYSTICPSGNCACYKITNGTITGNLLGKGTAALALNVDLGYPASPPTPSINGSNTCVPLLGTATASTTTGRGKNGSGVTTVLNIAGALCQPLTRGGNGSLNGGYGIASQTGATSALTGYGTVVGTINPKGILILNMKGPAS